MINKVFFSSLLAILTIGFAMISTPSSRAQAAGVSGEANSTPSVILMTSNKDYLDYKRAIGDDLGDASNADPQEIKKDWHASEIPGYLEYISKKDPEHTYSLLTQVEVQAATATFKTSEPLIGQWVLDTEGKFILIDSWGNKIDSDFGVLSLRQSLAETSASSRNDQTSDTKNSDTTNVDHQDDATVPTTPPTPTPTTAKRTWFTTKNLLLAGAALLTVAAIGTLCLCCAAAGAAAAGAETDTLVAGAAVVPETNALAAGEAAAGAETGALAASEAAAGAAGEETGVSGAALENETPMNPDAQRFLDTARANAAKPPVPTVQLQPPIQPPSSALQAGNSATRFGAMSGSSDS